MINGAEKHDSHKGSHQMTNSRSGLPKGGSYVFRSTEAAGVFTPEDFAEEHRMLAKTVSRFVSEKVFPVMKELEDKKEGLLRSLLVEAGEVGLLGADIPEQYGGFEMDEISSTIIAEGLGSSGCFGVTAGGQVGIGSLPIVFFGNEYQKKTYLPHIVTAQKVGAYALTEPGAGSDAMSAKTNAVLSSDGKYYVLNGAKQFITNAGIADLFIVYAKVDRDKFSAFIVDRDSEGLSLGAEEKKMGIKGSSTRSLYFDDVKVPVENLLFEIGRGHIVAFNILNIGRHKVSANALGCAKLALDLSAAYANERRQFNVPIAQFGMIREKLAEMAVRIYAAESMIYRTSGLLADMLHSLDISGPDGGRVAARGIEEYALECSMGKIFASEVQAFAVDEGVQVHGGYGYVSEYDIERLYRDARITRIFEGTNEINRILIPTMLVRRIAAGDLPLQETFRELRSKMSEGAPVRENVSDLIQAAKDVFVFTLACSRQYWGDALLEQQEVLGRFADILIGIYGMESAWLRARKAADNGESAALHKINLATAFVYGAIEKIYSSAREILSMQPGETERAALLADLDKLLRYLPIDLVTLRGEIAAKVSSAGKYAV